LPAFRHKDSRRGYAFLLSLLPLIFTLSPLMLLTRPFIASYAADEPLMAIAARCRCYALFTPLSAAID